MNREELRAKVRARGDEIERAVPYTAPVLGPVHIKLMSAKRASELAPRVEAAANHLDRIVLAAACVLCDDDGTLAYDIHKPEDLAELSRIDVGVLSAITKEANKQNAQSLEGIEEAGNV